MMINDGKSKEKAMVLLSVVMLITTVSIFLAGYATWTIWDQKNLITQEQAEQADALALAGLAAAKKDLFVDSNWLDGSINGNSVGLPSGLYPNNFAQFYSTAQNVGTGSYQVWISFLQNPKSCVSSCSYYGRMVWLRSRGTVGAGIGTVSRTLEELVSWNIVKNLAIPPIPGGKIYPQLQKAVDESLTDNPLAIADGQINEDVVIGGSKNYDIRGCYDPNWGYRNCMDYRSRVKSIVVNGSGNVTLGGITIE